MAPSATSSPTAIRAVRLAAELLDDALRAGVAVVPRVHDAAAAPAAPREEPVSTQPMPESLMPARRAPAALPSDSLPSPRRLSADERRAELAIVAKEVTSCTRCAELARTRTQTVFGVGNVTPRLVFLGEAPGADEDEQGEPFVGRAGQLLNKIIEACTLKREDVYILNILRCRPPGNRTPLPAEADNCRAFLDRQFEILQPEFICCLGSVAAMNLLQTEQSIGKLRGTFFNYRGAQVLCTYHPAYLLRNPPAKRQVWEDMQLLMARMGIELPQ